MCTSDLCNSVDYDLHTERALRLFRNGTASARTREGSADGKGLTRELIL